MNSKLLKAGIILGLLGFAGCAKKEAPVVAVEKPQPLKPQAIEVVKEQERSRHFMAVNRELELGGTLYGYVDVDGDALKLASGLQEMMTQIAAVQPMILPFVREYGPVFTALGLDDIKAVGVSSVPEGDGYFRNRAFFCTPGKRHGLLAGLGGPPAPFARLNLAPADTDIYGEAEIDLPAVYATIRDVVGRVGGEKSAGQFEQSIKDAGQSVAISALSVIQGWQGHMAMVGRLDREKTIHWPAKGGVTLPAFSLLLSIDGLAPAVREALAKSPVFSMRQAGTLQIYEAKQPLPVDFIQPILAIDGSTLIVATSEAFLNECRGPKAGLAEQPEFQKALARVGKEGNGLGYISPHFFTRLHDIEGLNPELPAEMKRTIRLLMAKVPQADRPLITVRSNLPDGILVRSYWNRSLKKDMAAIAFYNPVTIGLVAAMAIPAFQKVRDASQEKAIMNNLRQLSAAADQYYLENGVKTTTYEKLVGPDKYIRVLNSVAGESYGNLVFQAGQPLRVSLPSGKVITYR